VALKHFEALQSSGGSSSISWYIKKVGKHALLRAEEEALLGRQVKTMMQAEAVQEDLTRQLGRTPTTEEWANELGMDVPGLRRTILRGHHSKKAMILSNLRLVISIAKRYRNRGLSFQDLIQGGSLGLVRAVEKFDPEKGFKFSTYSTWWIKKSVLSSVADQSRTIRLPVHVLDQLSSMKKHQQELHTVLGRQPSEVEVAEKMGVAMDKLKFLMDSSRPTVSFEASCVIGGKHGGSGGDLSEVTLEASIRDSSPCPDEITEGLMLKSDVKKLVDTLSPREQEVIRMRFGLNAGKPKTREEMGNILSVTCERVRQIEARALYKLRQPYRNHKLWEYTHPELDFKDI
jgi:RNA polymerase primary sigma factor